MTKEKIREHLLKAAVLRMIDFGYPSATRENILTDEVYSMFFERMLVDNMNQSDKLDIIITEMLDEIKTNRGEEL